MEIHGLMERAERAEAEFFHHFISMAPAAVKARLGISTARLGGAAITSVRNDVTGYWTGVLGLGLDEPVTSELIDKVLDFFITEARATVKPSPLSACLPDRGRSSRRVDESPHQSTDRSP